MGKKQGRSCCAKAGLTFYYISKGPLGLTNDDMKNFQGMYEGKTAELPSFFGLELSACDEGYS